MAVNLEINRLAAGIAAQADAPLDTETAVAAQTMGKVLAGDSVKVVSGALTDLEALIARLKNENEETKQSIAQRRAAILDTVLSTMADRVNEEQRKNLIEIEKLNCEIDTIEKNVAGWSSQKTAAEARSAALDVEIKALENAIKNEVQNGEDHRKQVEKLKQQKAEEDAKIADLTNKIASALKQIDGLSARIAVCEDAVGKATLNLVAEAVREATGELAAPEKGKSQAELDKEAAKAEATDIFKAIHESLAKIDDEIVKTIEENRAEMV